MQLHQLLRFVNKKVPIVILDVEGIEICTVQSKDDIHVYSVDELSAIHSVIEKFIFFVQPKWKIANPKKTFNITFSIKHYKSEITTEYRINFTTLFVS